LRERASRERTPPTFRAATTLAISVGSALRQTVSELEVIIVGDGVDQATRSVAESLVAHDARVRFLDLPKWENCGDLHRDLGVREAKSDAIVYLADDDILLPRHVENMIGMLVDRMLVQSSNGYISADDRLELHPADHSDPTCIEWHLADPPKNCVSITGTTHSRSSYLELETGWTVTPEGIWSDLYTWRKYFRRSDFRGATHREMTTLQFPAECHRNADPIEFAHTIARWDEFSRVADVQQRMAAMLGEAEWRTLVGLTMSSAD